MDNQHNQYNEEIKNTALQQEDLDRLAIFFSNTPKEKIIKIFSSLDKKEVMRLMGKFERTKQLKQELLDTKNYRWILQKIAVKIAAVIAIMSIVGFFTLQVLKTTQSYTM